MYVTVVLCPDGGPVVEICVRGPVKQFALGAKTGDHCIVLKRGDLCLGGFVIPRLVALKDCEVAFLLALKL